MSRISLYERVALRRSVPELRLQTGDVATLIDYVPSPVGGEDGCVLEIFNAVGESLAVVTLAASDVEPLRSDEVLAVRQLAKIG